MATFIELKRDEVLQDVYRKGILRFTGVVTNAILEANEKTLVGGVYKSRKQSELAKGPLEGRPVTIPASQSLGFDIIDQIVILGQDSNEEGVGVYDDFFGNEQTFDSIPLATAILRVRVPRTIVKNNLIGAPGTIKQMITIGDFEVRVEAFIYDNEGGSPVDQILPLMTALQSTDPLKIQSGYLSAIGLDGYSWVVEGEPRIDQIRGTFNMVSVVFNLISDNIELYRIEKNS